jgi:hypothetical protein
MYDTREVLSLARWFDKSKKGGVAGGLGKKVAVEKGAAGGGDDEDKEEEEEQQAEQAEKNKTEEHGAELVHEEEDVQAPTPSKAAVKKGPKGPPKGPRTPRGPKVPKAAAASKRTKKSDAVAPAAAADEDGSATTLSSSATVQRAYDEARAAVERRLRQLAEVGCVTMHTTDTLAKAALDPPATWAPISTGGPVPHIMAPTNNINNTARYGMQPDAWRQARILLHDQERGESLLARLSAVEKEPIELSPDDWHLLVLAAMVMADPGRYMAQAQADALGSVPVNPETLYKALDAVYEDEAAQPYEDMVQAMVGLFCAQALVECLHKKF